MKSPPSGQPVIPCLYGKCSCSWISECYYLIIIQLKSNLISKVNKFKATMIKRSEMESCPESILSYSHPHTLLFPPGLIRSWLTSLPDIAALWNVYMLGKKLLFILNLHKDIFALPTVLMEPDSAFLLLQLCPLFHAPGPSRSGKRRSDSPR